MISNLDELKKYTEEVAARFPVIASEIKLCSPGYSEDQVVELSRVVPELPPSYLNVASQVKLVGVSIGQFSLWPVPYGKKDFTTSLTEANKDYSNPFLDFYSTNGLVEVACLEANKICLGSVAVQSEGQVFLVDISSDPNPVIHKLADNFEQLLVLAGNLHEISRSYEDDEDSGINEFASRLKKFGLDSSSISIWNELLEEALS